jgi:3-phenylpropionate/cinnamic acid dioxygenase small subunit
VTTDLISRSEIEDLFADYNAALDDRDLERWLSFFMEACSYVVTTTENVDRGWSIAIINCETRGMMIDRIAAIRNTMTFLPRQQRRIVSGIRVVGAEGAAARVRSAFAVFETLPSEPTKFFVAGQALDVVGREDGRLKLASRRCVLDAALVPNSLIYPI